MIRYAFVVVLLIFGLPGNVAGQSRAADSLAILALVEQRAQAMSEARAEPQRSIYGPEAVWINAFGTRRIGPDSIVAFLARLFRDPGYQESRLINQAHPEVFFIRPDVAVVHEYHERVGQRLSDGKVIDRRIHTTFVVSKEAGSWLIRYQIITDERERATRP